MGQGLLTSLDAIAGKQLTINEQDLANDAGRLDIGYYGSASVVIFSDGENVTGPDPIAMAQVASVAGVRVHTIGVGTAKWDSRPDRWFLGGDRPRPSPSPADRHGDQRVLPFCKRHRRAGRSDEVDRPQVQDRLRAHRGDRAVRRSRLGPAGPGRGPVGPVAWGGSCEVTFTWPLALLLVLAAPLLLGIYLLSLRRRRRLAVRYSSVALLRSVLPRRSWWKRHLPVALLLASIVVLAVGAARPQLTRTVSTSHTSVDSGSRRVPVHVRHRRQPQPDHRRPARGQGLRRSTAFGHPHRPGRLRRAGSTRRAADDGPQHPHQGDRQSVDVVRYRHRRRHVEGPRRHCRGGPGREASR